MRTRTWSARVGGAVGALSSLVLALFVSLGDEQRPWGTPLLIAAIGGFSVLVVAITRAFRSAGALAMLLGAVLAAKPLFFPLDFRGEPLSITAESHLVFLGPALPAFFLGVLLLLAPRPRTRPMGIDLAVPAAILLVVSAAGLFLLFANTRGTMEDALTLLLPALLVALSAMIVLVRSDADVRPPHALTQLGDGGTSFTGVSAHSASFLREIAAAPAICVPLSPGARIGRFRIERRIGEGGMGTVYSAIDDTLHRTVALKLLQRLGDPMHKHRFQREAQAAARVVHRNVVTVFEAAEDSGVPFLVMELVSGPSLGKIFEDRARGSREADAWLMQRAASLCRQLSEGLAAAHAQGVVHRDLKPDNVLIDPAGVVKIVDFGLARLEDAYGSLTRDGHPMGTPSYMSPEQARGQPADKRSDVFAFGALTFEMLSGKRLFRGESIVDVFASIASYAGPDRAALSGYAGLGDVIARCLNPVPHDRFADGSELLEAIEQMRWPPPVFSAPQQRRFIND